MTATLEQVPGGRPRTIGLGLWTSGHDQRYGDRPVPGSAKTTPGGAALGCWETVCWRPEGAEIRL